MYERHSPSERSIMLYCLIISSDVQKIAYDNVIIQAQLEKGT